LSLEGKIMHRNKSKLGVVALVAAMVLAVPAVAKSTHSGKAKTVASLSAGGVKAERAPAAYGSARRAPTFAAPNPNSPALIGAGSTTYNVNLYVY
jgi:hypothetical protein